MRAFTLLLLAACACLGANRAFAMDMGGMNMGGGMGGSVIAVSQNMADPCYKDPSAATCQGFRRGEADVAADHASLCAAMDFMVGCTLYNECKNGTADATSPFCKTWSIVGNLCIDMGRMKGCEAWNALCNNTASVVAACKDPAPLPGVLTTQAAKDAVVAICKAEPTLDGCATCDWNKSGWAVCADYLTTLSLLCQEVPSNENCSSFNAMCAGEGVASAFPELCVLEA